MIVHQYYHADFGHFAVTDAVLVSDEYTLPEGAVSVPDKPDGEFRWDTTTESWVADDASRHMWREDVQLSKASFCLGLLAMGILTPEGAEDAALGKWPAEFEAPLLTLDADQRAQFRIAFAGAAHIRRNHPALALVQSMTSVTDEDLDELFGWKS